MDLKINQELNAIAEEFLTKIRSAVVDLLFKDNLGDGIEELLEHKCQKQQQQKHEGIKLIVDKKYWYKMEQ